MESTKSILIESIFFLNVPVTRGTAAHIQKHVFPDASLKLVFLFYYLA